MVNVSKGVLLTCDPAMKQFLLYLDDKNELGQKFIIADLDDNHLFVVASIIPVLKQKIDALLDQLSPDIAEK